MGVISTSGLVGIVRDVSENYAHIISLLNSQTRISATVKNYAYPGNLVWKELDTDIMTLEAIPKHVNISIGDTVITNGFSTIFPPNLEIGTIKSFNIGKGSSDYNIKVHLFNNIPNTAYVYVINNRLAAEQLDLQNIADE